EPRAGREDTCGCPRAWRASARHRAAHGRYPADPGGDRSHARGDDGSACGCSQRHGRRARDPHLGADRRAVADPERPAGAMSDEPSPEQTQEEPVHQFVAPVMLRNGYVIFHFFDTLEEAELAGEQFARDMKAWGWNPNDAIH